MGFNFRSLNTDSTNKTKYLAMIFFFFFFFFSSYVKVSENVLKM